MRFHTFKSLLPKIKEAPLLASEAHLKMAPIERIRYLHDFDYSLHNPRQSAVLSLFYPKNKETYLLLIVRAAYPGIHSSQIAFPGGKREEEDTDLMATALRETNEEVGVLPERIRIVKKFSELYIPPSNFLVTPFMGIQEEELQVVLDPHEVADYIELPLASLLDESIIQEVKMTTSYAVNINVPAYLINGHIVWGATAMIMSEIKETINNALL